MQLFIRETTQFYSSELPKKYSDDRSDDRHYSHMNMEASLLTKLVMTSEPPA